MEISFARCHIPVFLAFCSSDSFAQLYSTQNFSVYFEIILVQRHNEL